MITKQNKNAVRQKRHLKVRDTINGTAVRPRLSVYKSLNHIYVQLIDDVRGNTLLATSTLDKAIASELSGKSKKLQSEIVGAQAAKKAIALGILEVVFDRGGYRYAGRVKMLADGARKAGLKI